MVSGSSGLLPFAEKVMNRHDWNLLVINAAGDSQLSPVQLQKSLFLIRENLPEAVGDDFYEFVPYSYGPFCAEVYQDAERLQVRNGFVHIEQGQYKQYSVTPAGRNRSTEIESHLAPETVDYVHRVVAWAKSLSFNELVQAIYQKYPEYRVNSVFQG